MHIDGNWNVLFPPSFQIQQTNLNNEEIMSDLSEEETDGQQEIEIDYQRLSDLFNEMFWRSSKSTEWGFGRLQQPDI